MAAKRRSLASKISIVLGIALIAAAVIILLADIGEKKINTENANKALERAEKIVGEGYCAYPEERGNSKMPAMKLEGVNVVGIIEVPRYELKLVIGSSWDKSTAAVMPCKLTGSVYNRDIVIGASKASGQFSFADTMETGTVISITDMEGGKYTYTVEKIEHAKSFDQERFQEGNWDLTVFVKASSVKEEYILLRCRVSI